MKQHRLRVAILGSGNIGTDLLYKVRRSPLLKCSYLVGRRSDSPGLARAREMGIYALTGGIDELMASIENIDLVFDATSARDHIIHSRAIIESGKHLINLTPAKLGAFFVPKVTQNILNGDMPKHLNMVTCGGQTSIPIIHALRTELPEISSVEVVSTISSSSAGPATRQNLDEYIENTEKAITDLASIGEAKALILLNPAIPEILMHTSIYLSIPNSSCSRINLIVLAALLAVEERCPGYKLLSETISLGNDIYHLSISVQGAGDYLPIYAGNLDIINVAAIYAAEEIGKSALE